MENSTGTLGPQVSTEPARPPPLTSLIGRFVHLEPLVESHKDDLFAHVGGPENSSLWTYMPSGPFTDPTSFRTFIGPMTRSTDPTYYAILDRTTNKAVGYLSLMRIDTTNRCIEVGNIMFSPTLQGTATATEAIYLLAKTVFEDLGYRRFEWKCNALNDRSRRAAERFGFVFEGVFRQHMVVKGRSRDTAWFAMLDGEWPAVKAGFEAWLDPRNFDAEGRQRRSLKSIRGGS